MRQFDVKQLHLGSNNGYRSFCVVWLCGDGWKSGGKPLGALLWKSLGSQKIEQNLLVLYSFGSTSELEPSTNQRDCVTLSLGQLTLSVADKKGISDKKGNL